MSAAKAKTTVIGIEIPRDQLALEIAIACLGMKPPAGATPKQAFDQMARVEPAMVSGFYAAADRAVMFFHQCVNDARQPS
ncbi:hypothetical protein ABC347_07945 [Sphingomonas sp. 1P06PA]|uniref:hypothetical protein n=1 Tax=Sphingomonas sp. 1P06PA TaxID=554121 RepID=UPI0039A4AF10